MFASCEEKGKIYTQIIKKKPLAVTIQTESHTIQGTIYLRLDDRMIDSLNGNEKFIAITGASISDAQGNIVYQGDFLALNRDQIAWIIPADNADNTEE